MEIVLQWENRHISLNDWYSGKHWTYRKKQKDEWMKFMYAQFSPHPKIEFNKFQIEIYHNTRCDCDNLVTISKLTADFMKKNGYCVDDSKKFYKKLSIEVDTVLPKNGIKVIISEYV
jgi:Holliday junction resolvase RusA-like endonuclease